MHFENVALWVYYTTSSFAIPPAKPVRPLQGDHHRVPTRGCPHCRLH